MKVAVAGAAAGAAAGSPLHPHTNSAMAIAQRNASRDCTDSPLTMETYNHKCNPKQLPNETLGFNWDGSTHSTHNTAKFCDWSVSNQEQISLVKMFSLISQPISTLSQQDFNHGHISHIHSQQASQISCMNLWVHAINATLQQEKCTHFQTHFVFFWTSISLFPQKPMAMQFHHQRQERKREGTKR